MRFTVSILTFIALRQAKACIASVLKSTVPFKLILTANGNPEVADYFKGLACEFDFITVVVNETNEGFIPPNRRAFDACDTEFFVMLNDDTIIPPDWLEKLAAPFDRFPTGALSGPRGGCQSLQASFHGFLGPNFEYLEGSCLCVKVEKVRPLGLFDPRLKFAYGEDSDLSLRMREAGLTLHHADFQLAHEGGATSRHVKDVRKTQEENHSYLRHRWGHYLRIRKFEFSIILHRGAALGDVLLTTPLIRELRRIRPLSPIIVETSCPQIFANNPMVSKVERRAQRGGDAMFINLDGAYENHPGRHIVESYFAACEIPVPADITTNLYLHEADTRIAERLMPGDNWVAIHAGPSTWKSKEWPQDRFEEVIRQLQASGMRVVLVGGPARGLSADLDRRGQTTVQQMGALIKRAKVFIGLDSLPFHAAEAVGTPAIGLFGVTDPKFISTRCAGALCVCGTVPSFGLRHRVKGVTVIDDGGQAMNSISIEAVMARVNSVLAAKEVVAA